MSEKLAAKWKILNERYGVFTEKQLWEEIKNTPLDVGIFTMPFENIQKEDKHEAR